MTVTKTKRRAKSIDAEPSPLAGWHHIPNSINELIELRQFRKDVTALRIAQRELSRMGPRDVSRVDYRKKVMHLQRLVDLACNLLPHE